jgi:outer membrane autotransporter protein
MTTSATQRLQTAATFVALAFAVVLGSMAGGASPARAQADQSLASRYCQPGFVFIGGFCVNPLGFTPTPDQCPPGFGPVSFGNVAGCGGASSAAFSALRMSSISRDMSLEGTEMVNDRMRRRADRERICRERPEDPRCRIEQFAALAGIEYAADAPGRRSVAPAAPVVAAVAPRPALWAQVFGDYERRDQSSTVALNQRVQTLDLTSRTHTGGIIGGADILFSNVALANDAVVLGVTGGYQESTTKVRTTQSEQRVSSSSIGVYGSYILGGFSLGLTAKTDFVELNSSFVDFANSAPFMPVIGGFETDGQNTSVGGTISYRFDLGRTGWTVEPTVGLDYTRSRFDDAAQLGLSNGSTLRARAGATFATFYQVSETMILQPSFGAFAFSNVDVDNGTNLTIDFNSLQSVQTDEGQVRGELNAQLTAIFANGFSAFAKAEVRFGEDLYGAAGRVGVRYQF